MITSVNISNFRCFRDLKLDSLKQFNFIVGDSGSGKTAFLEAMFLVGGSNPEIWMRLRQWRGASNVFRFSGLRHSYESVFRDIFYNFRATDGVHIKIVDDHGQPRELTIRYPHLDRYSLAMKSGKNENAMLVKPIDFTWRVKNRSYKSTVEYENNSLRFTGFSNVYPAWYSSPAINDAALIANAFSELSIKKETESFLSAVQTVFPYVEEISLESVAGEPALCVSVAALREKLPIGSISSGLNRFLALMLAIAANRNGMMLIDEFEVGFYHQNLTKLLETIFEFCELHNVQIFATTHSYAFLQAMVPLMKTENGEESDGFLLLRSERTTSGCRLSALGNPVSAIESNFEVR